MRFYIFKRYQFPYDYKYSPCIPHPSQTPLVLKNFVCFVTQLKLSALKQLWYKFTFLRYWIRHVRLLFLSSMLFEFFLFLMQYQIYLSKEVQAILAQELNVWCLATNSQRNVRPTQIMAENEFHFISSLWTFDKGAL